MQNERNSRAVPGALGLGQSTATAISNSFFVFSFMTPMMFAIASDAWLGRYKTLIVAFWYEHHRAKHDLEKHLLTLSG
jgi:POT family proton-dependent oligopeptide transporter